ncbi:hypothetical protein G6N76_09880 [Rhizobium daejeonense]|uniref:Phosphohydrolase n=2 Tax=Rhizobium daejeonense TaxID=240521 RepID=A0A6M1RZ24_9HYPH|nr:hypothetical protein [Rhizobium daejeonense]
MAQEDDVFVTTFGPLDKYVAANDNNPQPLDESGASTGFAVGGIVSGERRLVGESYNDLGVDHPQMFASRRFGDFMQVYSGRQFWPMDPKADEIHIEDIAHSLSLQCRYAGHCIKFYSVAEHSVLLAGWLLPRYGAEIALWGLLHDASEAYLVDVPRPLKPFLHGYKEAEARVMAAVAQRFGLALDMPPPVHEADDRIIADELVNLRPMAWHGRFDDPLGVRVQCWEPEHAEDEFLNTYVMLERQMGRVA